MTRYLWEGGPEYQKEENFGQRGGRQRSWGTQLGDRAFNTKKKKGRRRYQGLSLLLSSRAGNGEDTGGSETEELL